MTPRVAYPSVKPPILLFSSSGHPVALLSVSDLDNSLNGLLWENPEVVGAAVVLVLALALVAMRMERKEER